MIRHKIKRVIVSIVTTLFLSLIIGMMYLKYNQTRLETQKQLPQKWHLNGFSNAGLSNDTQTILKNNGQYELFYLVDSGKGLQSTKQRTRWSKSISSDLVNFQLKDDVNIKPVSNHESVATGSIVKDVEDIAGYGKNTLLAYATKYIDGNQWTYMWYSSDRGKRWKIANKGQPVAKPYKIGKAFRDPNVFYDSEQQQFVMTMAEADDDDHMKIGFYTSKNGISWKYTDSYYSPRNLGTLEVPEIHQVYQKNTGKKEWVLFFGANGFADDYQQSSGTYYVVGKLENGRFQSSSSPQRVDFGTDYYAAHHYQETASELLGFGWMGNWDYINAVSNDITYKGNYSAFRKIFLDSENRLKTSKVMTENIFDTKKKSTIIKKYNQKKMEVNKTAYKINTTIHGNQTVTIRSKNDDSSIKFTFDNFDKKLTVHRKSKYVKNDNYSKEYNVSLWGKWSEKIDFYVDQYSVEVYWPRTGQIATFAKYSKSTGDELTFDNLDTQDSQASIQEMK